MASCRISIMRQLFLSFKYKNCITDFGKILNENMIACSKRFKESADMIEIVTNKERNLRNVTQIGTPREDNKIYIENLAYTRLKDDGYASKNVFVLMGHTECMENRYITFVEAIIPVNTIDFAGNLPKWNDYVWKDVFREIKRLYEDMIIVGWALDLKGMTPKITPELERIHKEHFSSIHQLLFLMDSLEGEETVYVQKGNSLTPKDGFYIYYCTRAKSEHTQQEDETQHYENLQQHNQAQSYENNQNIESIPITRKKPDYEQRKNVDRLIGLERTSSQENQAQNTKNYILQMRNHETASYESETYRNTQNRQTSYHNNPSESQNYKNNSNQQTSYQKEYQACENNNFNHASAGYEMYENRQIRASDRKNRTKEEPSVELDVNLAEWTSSRGGKYRQMLKENEKKKNSSSGTNIGIAIAAAMLVFVIGVGIYENGDALLKQADKAAEAMSGNAQKAETQETQTEAETQSTTQTGTIPIEIISGENQ